MWKAAWLYFYGLPVNASIFKEVHAKLDFRKTNFALYRTSGVMTAPSVCLVLLLLVCM